MAVALFVATRPALAKASFAPPSPIRVTSACGLPRSAAGHQLSMDEARDAVNQAHGANACVFVPVLMDEPIEKTVAYEDARNVIRRVRVIALMREYHLPED